MLYSFLFLAGICCVAIVGMVAAIDVHYVALRVEDFRFVGLECVNVYFNLNVYDLVVGLDGKKDNTSGYIDCLKVLCEICVTLQFVIMP